MTPPPAALQLLLIAAVLLGLTALLAVLVRQRHARQAALRAFARAEGLHLKPLSDPGAWVLHGRFRGHSVHVGREWGGDLPQRALRTTIRLDLGVRLPPGLVIQADGSGTPLRTLLGIPDVQVGERRLDEALTVQGPERQARILLRDGPLRAALLRWVGRYRRGRIAEDQVVVELTDGAEHQLEAALTDAARMADALSAAVRRLVEPDPADALGQGAIGVRARLPPGAPEGTVGAWRVAPGDHLDRDAVLCEVLTVEGTILVQARVPGTLTRVLQDTGAIVRAGAQVGALRPDAGVSVPAEPAPRNPSGFELIDLDLVDLHPQERLLAERGPRLDIDSPRPPGVPSRPPERGPATRGEMVVAPYDPDQHFDLDPEPPPDPGDLPTNPAGMKAPNLGPPATLTALLSNLLEAQGDPDVLDALVAPYADTVWCFDLDVDEVRWTASLSLPDDLQRGRTATGRLVGHDVPVSVRFPGSRNGELDTLARAPGPRAPLTVVAHLVDWDALYKRPVFHAR